MEGTPRPERLTSHSADFHIREGALQTILEEKKRELEQVTNEIAPLLARINAGEKGDELDDAIMPLMTKKSEILKAIQKAENGTLQ